MTTEKTEKNIEIGYSDFIRLCRVNDPEEWCGWLSVRDDGVYVKSIDKSIDLTPQERATLTEHPTRDLSKPALYFPCTLKDLQHFLEQSEVYDYVDPFDLLEWYQSEYSQKFNLSLTSSKIPPEKPLPTQERNSMLIIIAGLCQAAGINLDARGNARNISEMVQKLGANISEDTVHRVLQRIPDAIDSRNK